VRDLRILYEVENTQVTIPIFLLIVDEKKIILASVRLYESNKVLYNAGALFSQVGTVGPFISALMGFNKKIK